MKSLKIILQIVLISALAYFSYLMLLISLEYYPLSFKVGFLRIKQWMFHKYPGTISKIWFTAFYIHVITSLFVLLAGFTQFFKALHKNRIHKYAGRFYVFIVLFLAAPSGFIMGIFANGGPWSQASFIILSVIWWISTFMGFRKAVERKFDSHRNWIIISYALTLSALTLRAWKYGITNFTDLNIKPMDLYRIVAWIGWVPNLIIAIIIVCLKGTGNKTITRSILIDN